MKKTAALMLALALTLALPALPVFAEEAAGTAPQAADTVTETREEIQAGPKEGAADWRTLISDLTGAWKSLNQIDRDAQALNSEIARSVAEEWKQLFLYPGFRFYLHGTDDPAALPIQGRHAFVVLGFELQNGEMTDELKARCDAAAAAAKAFPASILICSGGATGSNNPQGHTEAGLMKAYLSQVCGIGEERIFTEEKAVSTAENALNTFELLRARGIEEITLVTSSYHQRRAQMLYAAVAAFYRHTEGYAVTLAGNYGCDFKETGLFAGNDALITGYQLEDMMKTLLSGQRKIREMVVNYGAYGEAARERNAALLAELAGFNPAAAGKWESILGLWKEVNGGIPVHEGVLPDGLPDTDEMCIVTLGFQLNPDGSMKEELIQRLRVALRSAEKYPNALLVCTGGGTAAENQEATEAGKMAEWLVENGVDPARILVEDRSLTTAQNAQYTLNILEESCPRTRLLAIVSSDYHIATGTLLFSAEATLRAEAAGREKWTVVSNAAYKAPAGSLSPMFQAGALIELSGDVKTAFEIYYETYDIHELPPLK